ncbi:hypothetical protein PR048_008005 [Dryococelus australis]|uniref:Ubiquitin-like protein ATG12 n=1 Tax=Dryococelus australis TaxID=614101 RepID=A0ABQ9HVV1_9NEOP|nr:hypothetical protein PR048_008005 [Dryococelus australis]
MSESPEVKVDHAEPNGSANESETHGDKSAGDNIQSKIDKQKVDILLKATGNAPIMKKKKWAVDPDKRIGWIIEFVRKYLKLDPAESLVGTGPNRVSGISLVHPRRKEVLQGGMHHGRDGLDSNVNADRLAWHIWLCVYQEMCWIQDKNNLMFTGVFWFQFLYVNQVFAPAPDQIVRNLYDCYGTDGKLVLHYCKSQAWG